MATEAKSAADVREALVAETQKKIDEQNKARTGKGTRLRVGQTRGKNPQVITWEAFDDALPATNPVTLSEFMDLVPAVADNEPLLVSFLVEGYNSAQYTSASDPIAEFVDATWPEEIQRNFRTIVRNYSRDAKVSLEDAVALIKPGIVASQKK